jgi:hypothetical protein
MPLANHRDKFTETVRIHHQASLALPLLRRGEGLRERGLSKKYQPTR